MSIAERTAGGTAVRAVDIGHDLIGPVGADVAARLIAASTDLSLILDDAGFVRDVAVGSLDLSGEGLRDWVGKPLAATMAGDSRDKAAALLADASGGERPRPRQINHLTPRGADLPVRYTAMRLGPGRVLLVGRELRALAALQRQLSMAEQAVARDYARIGLAEGRYRMLFHTSTEAVLIIEPASFQILEANPALVRLAGLEAVGVEGKNLLDLIDPGSRDEAETLLSAIRLTARGDDVLVRLRGGGPLLRLSAALFRQDGAIRCLVRLIAISIGHDPTAGDGAAEIMSVIERLPDSFVVTAPDRRVRTVNAAFLELAQLSIPEQARGERIDRWLGRTDVDVDAIVATLRERGQMRQFATVVRGEYGSREDVEVTAVALDDVADPCLGFLMRRTSQRQLAPSGPAEHSFSVERLRDLVGQVSLKELVKETTDEVERRCIEAALRLTRDNRASAAEMLGLSRQGLYAKLRRYGLIGDDDNDGGD
jgi:transcriptional regulator PpsR